MSGLKAGAVSSTLPCRISYETCQRLRTFLLCKVSRSPSPNAAWLSPVSPAETLALRAGEQGRLLARSPPARRHGSLTRGSSYDHPPPEMAACGILSPPGLNAPAVHQIFHLPVSKSLPFLGVHITDGARAVFFPSREKKQHLADFLGPISCHSNIQM